MDQSMIFLSVKPRRVVLKIFFVQDIGIRRILILKVPEIIFNFKADIIKIFIVLKRK